MLFGKPRIDKSTAIKRNHSTNWSQYFVGFYSVYIRNFTNRTCVTLNSESKSIAGVNSESSIRVGSNGVDFNVFENIALNAAVPFKGKLVTGRCFTISNLAFC